MTKEAYEQMMAGLREAEEEYSRIVFPDCTAKYYAVRQAVMLLEERDALAMLNEPKTVLHREDGDYCPRCSTISTRAIGLQKLHLGTSYCPYCGQAVKWDADD